MIKKRIARMVDYSIKIMPLILVILLIAASIFLKEASLTGLTPIESLVEEAKTFEVNEKITDENNSSIGKKTEDETAFETVFAVIQKNEEGLLLVLYHTSETQQPIWIEGNINYSLSNTVADSFQNITLIVPKINGIVPKFKLHIGPASETFEFGKTIPTINFDGDTTLIDRNDEKIDLNLIKENSRIEIKGLNNIEIINAKIIQTEEPQLKTNIFAADSITIDNATITLPKKGRINAVLECNDFNIITDSCTGEWSNTNIPFTENETHITFLVNHFSGYAGAEINIINVQSYPALYGNWTVQFNTTGTANLTIKATNGTTWSLDDDRTDLQFLELKCGENILNYSWIDNTIFIEDYNCTELSYETSKPMTTGKHTLEFTYGDDVKYAYNDVITSCGVEINTSTTLTNNLLSNGTCITINNNSVTLDCANYNITGNRTGNGVAIANKINITIANCNIYNFSRGINLTHTNSTTIINNTIGYHANGIQLYYSDHNTIIHTTTHNNTNQGLTADYSNNNTIYNVTARSNKNIGFYFSNSHFLNITQNTIMNTTANDAIQIFISNNSNIIGNRIQNNKDDAIVSNALNNVTIKDNSVDGGEIKGKGFNIKEGGTNSTITNNVIGNCSYYGIENSNRANGNTIANNTISNCTYGISLYNLNETIIRNNTIAQCAHGISFPTYGGVRRVKILENTISECHNKSTTDYQNLPAGIFIESLYLYNEGAADNQIYNNTFINNSRGLIVWGYSGGINISQNIFINNTNGAYTIIGGKDIYINNNIYENNAEVSGAEFFEPTIVTENILASSQNITVVKYIPPNSTALILIDAEKNNQNLAVLSQLIVRNQSGTSMSPFSELLLAPNIGRYGVFSAIAGGYYTIIASSTTYSSNATGVGELYMNFIVSNVTLSIFPFSKSAYAIIHGSNITIENENYDGNSAHGGLYILNSSSITLKNVSIFNSKDSFIINMLAANFTNSNVNKNIIIKNTDCGDINFTQDLNITSAQLLNNIINITQTRVYVNSLLAPEFNTTAVLTFKNISHLNLVDPQPMVDLDDDGTFEACTDCTEISYTNNETYIYSVSHFTDYSMNETPITSPPGGSRGGGGGMGGVIRPALLPAQQNIISEQTDKNSQEEIKPAEISQEQNIPTIEKPAQQKNTQGYELAIMTNQRLRPNKRNTLLLLLTAIVSIIIIIALSRLPKRN